MFKLSKLSVAAMILVLLFTATAIGDIVHLKDGRKLEGKIISETKKDIRLEMHYGETTIEQKEIEKIEKKPWSRKEPAKKQKPVAEESETKKPAKVEVFTVDDWARVWEKFEGYGREKDKEAKFLLLKDWMANYAGKKVTVESKIVDITKEQTKMLTDEGEKTLSIMRVRTEYFDLSSASHPQNRNKVWVKNGKIYLRGGKGHSGPSALSFEYKVPKTNAGSSKVGGIVFLTMRFPTEEPLLHRFGEFFESVALAASEEENGKSSAPIKKIQPRPELETYIYRGRRRSKAWFKKMYKKYHDKIALVDDNYYDIGKSLLLSHSNRMYHEQEIGDYCWSWRLGCEVVQVIDGDEVMVRKKAIRARYTSRGRLWASGIDEVLFHVRGLDTTGLIDNASFKQKPLVYAGTYNYTTVLGAKKTIRSYVVYKPLSKGQFAKAIAEGFQLASYRLRKVPQNNNKFVVKPEK